jgi:SpoVK/Ycf46/Vps4 family AAA+-type ATPase
MPKPPMISVLKHTPIADPAVQSCVVALLRIIAKSPAHGARLPSEALKFLGCVSGPDDLLASFSKVGQRKAVEQAMRKPVDENDDPFDGDLDGSTSLLQMLTNPIRNSRLSVTPRSRVVAAIKAAQAPAIQSLALTLLEKWEASSLQSEQDWMDTNVHILQGLFGLSDVEAQVAKLAFAFASMKGQSNALAECIEELFYCRSGRRQAMNRLAPAVNCAVVDLSSVFSGTSPLRSSGLLYHAAISSYDLDDVLRLSELGQLFASESFENEAAIRQRVLSQLVLEANPSLVFTHLAQQQRDISALLGGSITTGARGINVLLYGQPGTGKTEFAKKLACELGVTCYEVGYASDETGMEASRNDRLCFLKLANRLIPPEERAVILLDEAEDIFDSIGGQSEHRRSPRTGSKAWMNALLEGMRIPTIWITNDIEIDTAHLRRFAYVTEFATPPISVRREIVRLQTAGLAITDATITQLARNDALTPAMLGMAAQFLRLVKPVGTEADAALVRHVQASQRALNMEPAGSIVDSETEFDPRFINLDSSISVENLLGALRRTGRAGLLFHGPSGSGKTQLANYLGQQLDREVIYRTGSDLLNKYVGGTEQRIAKLFRSCDFEREIIFLDEAEGLLGSREGAQRSWEVTQVNEFLRQIEQFKGILIAATNHVGNLDAALMRRFAFRLGFKPLTLEQRVAMFVEVSGLALEVGTANYRRLEKLDALTAGDFANVSRRLGLLERGAESKRWLDELVHETAARPLLNKTQIGFL